MEKQNCGKIILASASPRRSELLARAGFDFEVVVSDAAEVGHIDPKTLVLRNARAKAEAVAARFPDRIVLGADTIVALGNEAFGKPKDMDEAFGMLKSSTAARTVSIRAYAFSGSPTPACILTRGSRT